MIDLTTTFKSKVPEHVFFFFQYMAVGHCDNEQINAYLDRHPEVLGYLVNHPEYSDKLYEKIKKGVK